MSMPSLPISSDCCDTPSARVTGLTQRPDGAHRPARELVLLQAFRSFAKVAGSLEESYGQLQAEVERLRRELAERNGTLARSVEDRQIERARQARILEGLPCGVLAVFENGKIWKANPEALRLVQFDSCGTALEAVSNLPPALSQFLGRVRTDGGERELELALPDGTTRWLAARHAPATDGMSVFILRDVTEHKRLEETEAQLRREQALAEITAVLAHEVRNPLASLELFAGLLADSGLEGEPRQWLDHLRAGLRTLAATVNNVLDFHSMPRRQFTTVDVVQLLDWVLNFCGPLARISGISIRRQTCAPEISCPGDRHGLEQVLLNLVLNSIKALPHGGWIEVSAGRLDDGRHVELTVADNGPGISPSCLPKIFEAGFSTKEGSPGLGLAVCRKIVEQHRGILRAESSSQGGTRVRVLLPQAADEERFP